MRKKEQACQAWKYICKNCKSKNIFFAGLISSSWIDTKKYLEMCDEDCDKFSIATLSKDNEAIEYLYDTVVLDDRIKKRIKQMLKHNNELLLTLNPFTLQEKYSFLELFYDELVLDPFIQDKLLSLDGFELNILEKIFKLLIKYGVKSKKIISTIIKNIGCSSIPGRNNQRLMNRFDEFFRFLEEFCKKEELNDDIIGYIGYILKFRFFPSNDNELKNYSKILKKEFLDRINKSDDVQKIKDDLLILLFGMNSTDATDFINDYNIEGISDELLKESGVVELLTIKMILNENNIDKLKEISNYLLNDKDFNINLFSNCLLEENVLNFFANEFNKVKPNLNELPLISTVGNIKIYDLGLDFYSIVKTLGAFSDDGSGINNYYSEWNDNRYRSHVNAVSLVRNDNLAFAEPDGKRLVKIGFYDFENSMFLGGGTSDRNSITESRDFFTKIFSKLYIPSRFIDFTREWHNELDYERKNSFSQSSEFKKNPDFLILDQECEDLSQLSDIEQKEYEEYRQATFKAAEDFGNLPIFVINREKIARNEISQINKMVDFYKISHDYDFLKSAIIKFNNNRNGCRGPQHTFIRENYFSNNYFQELLNVIDSIILAEYREQLHKFIVEEYNKMARCSYDDSTIDLPTEATNIVRKGGLNV